MRFLFPDESGSHNLAVVDPQYPAFTLDGIIIEQELFDSKDLILYTTDLTHIPRAAFLTFNNTIWERLC